MTATVDGEVPGALAVCDLRDLDDGLVLEAMLKRRRCADRAEADLLALAVHYADLHPAGEDQTATSWSVDGVVRAESVLEGLAGSGTPSIAEHAVATLGGVLGISYRSALGLVGEALEICFRLPRLWELVRTGHLQAWKARQVARHTPQLSAAAVAFVDRHVAVTAVRNQVPAQLPRLVHEALLRCDPDLAEGREEAALAHRDVRFDHTESTAMTQLTATLDTLDALDLDATVSEIASGLGRLGDASPLGVRRSHALGLLAHPQRVLEVFGGLGRESFAADSSGDRPTSAGASDEGDHRSRLSGTLYLHVDVRDLAASAAGSPGASGSVERVGSATLELVGDWLRRLEGVTVRPVLDMRRRDTVDRHDPPGWMREAVVLRDGHCVFPGCTTDARACDLDHIEPYRPPGTRFDETSGPPGQTRSDNLAALCRRHHRLKTLAGWRYRRCCDGHYRWTDPHGRTYAAHPTATGPIPRAP